MNWKKEIKSWAIILGVFGFLYLMNWHTPVIGKIQSVVLSTGLFTPNVDKEEKLIQDFNYAAQFKDLNGNPVNMESLRGKTVFINLWATWCPPCRAEMPHIASLHEKLKDEKNIAFLMVSLDQEIEKAKKFIEDKSFNFPVVHASYGLNSSFKHESIPTTMVISPEGKMVFRHEGMSNFDNEEFRNFLLSL
ncbi:TlpA family protein disulfide reductase [Echinicola salinicaeni]|uniref:TlpA family protein disulfide reductase n=1 Tax=Echinicola salinicaeni TaxID=2762757 RepID=UPI0016491E69|nr:TlpA disulfide reductase family protein [Echinicola salinicaeni]